MTPFNLGDRVTSDYRPSDIPSHTQATVIGYSGLDDMKIRFDGTYPSDKMFGHGEGNNEWCVEADDLKRVPFKPSKTFSPNGQCGKLLTHLAMGRSITPLEAFCTLSIYRKAARLHELRRADHKIRAEICYDEQNKSCARYTLKSRKFG